VLLQGLSHDTENNCNVTHPIRLRYTGANLASAQGSGFGGSGFKGGGSMVEGGGNFHGRSSVETASTDEAFVGYGLVDGYGYGYDNGYADWYGISPGYDECPLFRQACGDARWMAAFEWFPIC